MMDNRCEICDRKEESSHLNSKKSAYKPNI